MQQKHNIKTRGQLQNNTKITAGILLEKKAVYCYSKMKERREKG